MLREVAGADDLAASPMLTREDCAQLLGVTVWNIRTWTEQGMPCYRSGESVRYHRAEILRWWAEGRESGVDAVAAQLGAVVRQTLHDLAQEFDLTISVRRRGQ